MESRLLIVLILFATSFSGCKSLRINLKEADSSTPKYYPYASADSTNIAQISWENYFNDTLLNKLISEALINNQELNIVLQEIAISQSEVQEKKGDYLPFVGLVIGAETEKSSRYSRNGAVEHEIDILENKEFPEPLANFQMNLNASWELDIYKKLRNAKNAAQLRKVAQTDAKNFLVTQLISEIASSYYELVAMDNMLAIIDKNLKLQEEALRKVELLKENAMANQLVVNRFNAQLLNTKNQQYAIKNNITIVENKINFLVGRFPEPIDRISLETMVMDTDYLSPGLPAQLLTNRPDILQSEYNLAASNLDVSVARANFYPSLDLKAGIGFQAFNPKYLVSPESLIFNVVGDLVAPLINRNAIKAAYAKANAMQVQAVYEYEATVINAYCDVLNQLNKIENYEFSYTTKQNEVDLLNNSIKIANNLFQYAKADYVEVLLTQEEALDAEMELTEIKLQLLHSKIDLYRALGGGWQ